MCKENRYFGGIKIFRRDFLNDRYIFKILFGGGVIALLLAIRSAYNLNIVDYKYIEGIFLMAYSEISISYMEDTISLLIWLTPHLYLMYILGDFMYTDFETNVIYIFTRTKNRSAWFLSKALWLLIYVAAYYGFQFLIVYFIGVVHQNTIYDISKFVSILLYEFFLVVFTMYLFILFLNILSLSIGTIFAFLASVLLNILGVFLSLFIYNLNENAGINYMCVLKLIPINQAVLTWHDIPMLSETYSFFIYSYIRGFTFGFSIAYLIFVNLMIVLYGMYKIQKMDIY